MTKLSPAAQAIKDAVLALYVDENVHQFGWQQDAPTVAVAIRAAAEQLGYRILYDDGDTDYRLDVSDLLAIAAELEGQP